MLLSCSLLESSKLSVVREKDCQQHGFQNLDHTSLFYGLSAELGLDDATRETSSLIVILILFYFINRSKYGVFSLIRRVSCRRHGYAGSKTLHQQNPPVLNWRCDSG